MTILPCIIRPLKQWAPEISQLQPQEKTQPKPKKFLLGEKALGNFLEKDSKRASFAGLQSYALLEMDLEATGPLDSSPQCACPDLLTPTPE